MLVLLMAQESSVSIKINVTIAQNAGTHSSSKQNGRDTDQARCHKYNATQCEPATRRGGKVNTFHGLFGRNLSGSTAQFSRLCVERKDKDYPSHVLIVFSQRTGHERMRAWPRQGGTKKIVSHWKGIMLNGIMQKF